MKRRRISMWIDEELVKAMDALAAKKQPPISRSQMIEWLLRNTLEHKPTETAI